MSKELTLSIPVDQSSTETMPARRSNRRSFLKSSVVAGAAATAGAALLSKGVPAFAQGKSGGSLSNIVLTLYGKSIHQAVATSSGLGVPITIVGTIGYILAGWPHQALLPPFSLGFVSLIGLAVMAPVSSLTAPYGARLAHTLSRRTLEVVFSCFLLLVSGRFLVSLI